MNRADPRVRKIARADAVERTELRGASVWTACSDRFPAVARRVKVRVTHNGSTYNLPFWCVWNGREWFNADGRGERPLVVRVIAWRV